MASSAAKGPLIRGFPLANALGLFLFFTDKDKVLARIPEDLRHYFDDNILASGWYPEADFWRLTEPLCALIVEYRDTDPWAYLGRKSAEIDLTQVYASMLVPRQPGRTLERFPELWSLYRDTGQPAVTLEGPVDQGPRETARLTIAEYPFAAQHVAVLMTAYLTELLELAGARRVQVECLDTGEVSGVCGWSLAWG